MRVIYTFFLLSVLFSCKKKIVDIGSQPNAPISVKDSFYFKAKLNGTDILWVVPAHKNETSFTYHAGASVGYTDLSNNCSEGYCYYVNASTQIFRNVADVRPQIAISFNMAASSRNKDVVLSWFAPGTKSYPTAIRTTSELLNPDKNGVVVYYLDQNGKSWSSNSGSQQGSIFESVSLTDEIRPDVSSDKVWKAAFSCMLYNNSGSSIKLEYGEICGPVWVR